MNDEQFKIFIEQLKIMTNELKLINRNMSDISNAIMMIEAES